MTDVEDAVSCDMADRRTVVAVAKLVRFHTFVYTFVYRRHLTVYVCLFLKIKSITYYYIV